MHLQTLIDKELWVSATPNYGSRRFQDIHQLSPTITSLKDVVVCNALIRAYCHGRSCYGRQSIVLFLTGLKCLTDRYLVAMNLILLSKSSPDRIGVQPESKAL